MIWRYNAARNDPYKEAHHPRYTPPGQVDDAMILRAAMTTSDVSWLDPAKNTSAASLSDLPGRDGNRGTMRLPFKT
jgi:ectoine hydroxylase